MRRYRNKLTGAVIEIPSELKGGLWEELTPSPKATIKPEKVEKLTEAPKEETTTPKKTTARKVK